MSQQPNQPPSTPQHPPTPYTNNAEGLQGLMSSLISPGPGTPMQNSSQMPWTGGYDWQNMLQSGPGFATQNPIHTGNQSSFEQNQEEAYEPPDTQAFKFQGSSPQGLGILPATREPYNPTVLGPFQQPGVALPVPHDTQLNSANEAPSNIVATPSAEAAEQNAKKLKELRAMLMAKKPKGSQDGSPVVKPTAAVGQSKPEPTRKNPGSKQIATGGSMSTDIENLVAEVRDQPTEPKKDNSPAAAISKNMPKAQASELDSAVNAKRTPSLLSKDSATEPTRKEKITNAPLSTKAPNNTVPLKIPHRPTATNGKSPSPDLSEGEIRSDDEEIPTPKEAAPVQKVSFSKEPSLDSQEKSRRESEVEAAYRQPTATSRESQEKLRRQSQVDQAYSPLKKPDGAMSKPPKPSLDTSSSAQRKNLKTTQTPKSAVEKSSRTWVNPKVRPAEYDSYKPHYQTNPPGTGQPSGRSLRNGEAEDRRRAVRQDERAPEEHRSAAEGRPQPERIISHTETTYLGRTDERPLEALNTFNRRHEGETQISPTQVANGADPDLQDWLELTEYHDEIFRKTRLARFRKKKELDQQRLQLEQEERLELEQRSLFRSGNLTDPIPTRIAPSPSLVIQTANIHSAPKSSGALFDNQVTPTLKRHHAEDETDTRNKVARVENNHVVPPSATNIAGGMSPTQSSQVPLEHRISRDDGQIGSRYRPRSRSQERHRRRSASPERRRYSVPEHTFTCHNCGQQGHSQYSCTLPRRDGKDRIRGQQGKRGEGVSSKYQGKKPQSGFQDLRAKHSAANRSIDDDDDKRP